MSFTTFLLILLAIIILYFLFKIGTVILIIALAVLTIYFLVSLVTKPKNENFSNTLLAPAPSMTMPNASRVFQINDNSEYNDLYSAVHEPWLNEYNQQYNSNYYVPASISEYCVDKKLRENNDIDTAISECVVPQSVSVNNYHHSVN